MVIIVLGLEGNGFVRLIPVAKIGGMKYDFVSSKVYDIINVSFLLTDLEKQSHNISA